MPTRQDFADSMPLMWLPELQALLPLTAKSLLENQQLKLSKDWESIHAKFPKMDYDDYVYNWLIVNTRTFHFVSHKKGALRFENPDDCMALNPFADYFNHTDGEGCTVDFGKPDCNTILSSLGIVFPKGHFIQTHFKSIFVNVDLDGSANFRNFLTFLRPRLLVNIS